MKSFDKTYALEPSFIVIALLFLSNKFLLIKALDSSPILNALSRNPENLFSDILIFDPLRSNPSPLKSNFVVLSLEIKNLFLRTSPSQKSKSI